MSDLLYEDEEVKVLANDKGVQISTQDGKKLRFIQYDAFFNQCEAIDKLTECSCLPYPTQKKCRGCVSTELIKGLK